MSDTDSEESSKKSLTMSVGAEPFVPRQPTIPPSDLSVDAPEFRIPQQNKSLSPHAREFVTGTTKTKLSIDAQEFVSTRTTLSVTAPEFVAANTHNPNVVLDPAEGYVEHYGYDPMMNPDFYFYDPNVAIIPVPEQGYMPAEYSDPYVQNGYAYYGDPMLEIISELHNVMESLTSDPADFKSVEPLVQLISECTSEQLQIVIDELFNQMLNEANFRYSGARICKYFYEHLQYSGDSFIQLLIDHCYRHFEGLIALREEPDKHCSGLCSFSLILGEFIANMKDVDIVISNLPNLLKEVLLQVLQHRTDEALGAVSLILKLTGGVLTEKNFDIQDILAEAKLAIQNISTPQALLLNGVLRRYSKSPSKQMTSSSSGLLKTSSRAQNYGIDLEPIYYDHMGQEFSAEEKAFMDSCGGNTNNEDVAVGGEAGYSGNNELVQDEDDDEMDPEIEAAFDQFLREIDESIVSPSICSNNSISFQASPAQPPAHTTTASNGPYPNNAVRNLQFTYVENQVMNRPDLHPSGSSGDFKQLIGGFNTSTTSMQGITVMPTAVNSASHPMAAAAWNMASQNGMSDISGHMAALQIDVNHQQRFQQQLQHQHLLQLQQLQHQQMYNGNAMIGGTNYSAVGNQASINEPLYNNGLTQNFQ